MSKPSAKLHGSQGKSDDSLSLGELRTLPVDEQWYSLGQALGMDTEELDSIQKTEANAFKCKAQMFRLWLQKNQAASWEKVVTALENINKTEVANELQSHHCTDTVSSGYASVESSISSVSWNKGSEEDETDGLKHDLPNLMDEATSLVSTVESETLSVEKDGVCSAGALTPPTPEFHKHTVKSSSSSSGYSYHSASSGEQIGLLNFPMSTSSLVIAPKASHVSAVPHSQTKQATILHSTGERKHKEVAPHQIYLDAVLKGDAMTVDRLLRNRIVKVDGQLKSGMTALMLASTKNHTDVVRTLLTYDASVHATDQFGQNSLHIAAGYGNYEIVKLLVNANSDVNATPKDHSSVLLKPSSKGFSIVVEFLLQNGADVNIADENGHTPLIAAVNNNHRDVVKLLLENKADVNHRTIDTSKTPLEEAARHNNHEIISMLTAAMNKATDKSRALFTCKTAERVRQLLKEGARVDERRGDGATPLHVHAENGNCAVVAELLREKADIDLKDKHGVTALMKASLRGHVEVVQTLITGQAVLDLKNHKGQTALMYAIRGKHLKVAEKLIISGSDVTIKDKSGKTPLQMAEETECLEIVELIKRHNTTAHDPNDPFLRVLTSYLEKVEASSCHGWALPGGTATHSPQEKRKEPHKTVSVTTAAAHAVDDTSTLKQELSKAWKRIADLETRIHDLTLRSTMDIPEETDLSYLDRGRLEEEYRKLKELKKKSENYAVEAKQTAQRVSAENFKLKEELARERHANEIYRKSMIAEVEEKVDKGVVFADAAHARREVLQQEINSAILSTTTLPPRPLAAPVEKLTPAYVKEIIMEQTIRASAIQIGVVGLPYSGKSTLLSSLLNLNRGPGGMIAEMFDSVWSGLTVFEAVRLRDRVNHDQCEWLPATKNNAICCSLAVALAQIFTRKGHRALPNQLEFGELFGDTTIDAHFADVFKAVIKVMQHLEDVDKTQLLSTASMTFINFWDLGMNKALYEIVGAAAIIGKVKNLLLVDVLDLSRDSKRLEDKLDMTNEELYGKRNRDQSFELFRLRTTLAYYILMILGAKGSTLMSKSALLVGTHADKFAHNEGGLTKGVEKVQLGVKARAGEYGLQDVICPGLIPVDARNPDDVEKVKKQLDTLIDEVHCFEGDIRLSWIFLRTMLHSTKRLFMPKAKVLKYAYKCGLQGEDELEEFLELFKNCASIIYSSENIIRTLNENVVLNPVAFIKGLDGLYSVDRDKIPDSVKLHLELLKHGFITQTLAQHIWVDYQTREFYIKILEEFGLLTDVQHTPVIVPDTVGVSRAVVQELSSSTAYFLPTLRQKPYLQKATKDDCNVLVVTGDSFLIARMVFHKQSVLVNYFTTEYPNNVKFIMDRDNVHYNVLHLQWWQDGRAQAEVYIRLHGVYGVIDIKPLRGVRESVVLMCHSALKAAAVNVLGKDDPNFTLGFICDKSVKNDYPDGLHFIKFHHLEVDRDSLFCKKCKRLVPLPPERKWWMNDLFSVPYERSHSDLLTEVELSNIAKELLPLTTDEVIEFAQALQFSKPEIERVMRKSSDTYDRLLSLLRGFKKRTPATQYGTRRCLAKALMEWGHNISLALQLCPKLVDEQEADQTSSLTAKEVVLISQHITNWQELAQNLNLSGDKIRYLLQQKTRSTSEQCAKMLNYWLAECNHQSPRSFLTSKLREQGYQGLADFLQTGSAEMIHH